MEEELYIRFFENRCTAEEVEILTSKMNTDPEFKHRLVVLKNLYISSLANDEKASNDDLSRFMEYAEQLDKAESEIAKPELKEQENIERKKYFKNSKIGKNDTGQKYIFTFRRMAFWSVAATILILLMLDLHYNWLANRQPAVIPIESLAAESINTLYTAKGIKGEVSLPDGSSVTLNSDSKITYPSKFEGPTREINFTGEAFFEVVKDSLRPMIIHCGKDFRIEVYGTVFNVKSYEEDHNAVTTLISGEVKVVQKLHGKEIITDIKPNQSCIIGAKESAKVETKPDPKQEYAWKEGKLIFKSTPLEEAVVILERWHGVDFEILDPSKKQLSITAAFTTESVFQIMDLLHFSAGIDYNISDNKVTIK